MAAALAADENEVYLVGHSFGGSVAMKAAALMRGRVTKLVLLETNPFYLLQQAGHMEAFAEAKALRDCIKEFGALGQWEIAAEKFADYWNGPGTWRDTPPERRAAFEKAIRPNFFEWDAVMDETTSARQWADLLPPATQIVYDPGTVLPIRTIVDVLRGTGRAMDLQRSARRRSHGALDASGPDQSGGRGILGRLKFEASGPTR